MSNINVENATKNLKAAKASYAVQVSRFDVGLSDMTSIIQAIQLLGTAIQARVDALRSYNDSVAELYRYSAEWPDGIKLVVDERMQDLNR